MKVEGVIRVHQVKGTEVLLLDQEPICKLYTDFNNKEVVLKINGGPELSYRFEGVAEVFYFEGIQKSHSGIKYVNDFYIDDRDIIELLIKHSGKKIELSVLERDYSGNH
ncbi:hypothetical protein [Neobacillus dielmonensis]|uniref:hypothetical protein n=1 Tax=Neobacillus dielmonensis TaxID=1347369 RepID=UPI0005AAED47|nr:hypothetical protein [Neobacillus dielmonensis]